MSRKPRKYLESSFFHVIIQGHKKEYIFKEKRYIYEYINLIKRYIKETNIKVVAYCMMNNHGHFLLQVDDIYELSKLMHKVNSAYARYYNYIMGNRVGYVFRDRFLSEPITSHRYLVECIKYIHYNPVKANMVKKCSQYQFSSYNFFCKKLSEKSFMEFLSEEDYENICKNSSYEIEFLDIDGNIQDKLISGIQEFLKKDNDRLYKIFEDREILMKLIRFLKDNKNISYLATRELLGITRGSMQKLILKSKKTYDNISNIQ